MSLNKYDSSTGRLTTLANGQRIWLGTKAAHDAAAAAGTLPTNCLIAITDDGNDQDDRYSTEETFTGKYWTDGRPIYRKVCYSTAAATIPGNGAAYTTIPGWYFSDIRTIVNWHCSVDLVQYHGDINLSKWATLYTNNVNVSAGSFLMVEYTKTTD